MSLRKTVITLTAVLALGPWIWAQTSNAEEKAEHHTQAQTQKSDSDAANPKGNITITSGPNVQAQSTKAVITWTTSGRAATLVHYGTDANNLSQKSFQAGGERDHSVTLSNLTPGTTYYFAIMTDDNTVRQNGQFQTQANGTNSAASSTTGATPAPEASGGGVSIVSGPAVNAQSTSATITWTTSGPAANEIKYGTDANNMSQKWHGGAGSTAHSASLSNLQPSTTYYYAILERNGGVRQQGQFQTTASAASSTGTVPGVSIAQQPAITKLGDRSATLHWTTNIPATSIVKYGTQVTNLANTGSAQWGTDHSVTISNLQPSTAYYFQVQSGETVNASNAAKGPIEQFMTLKSGATAQANPPCCAIFSH